MSVPGWAWAAGGLLLLALAGRRRGDTGAAGGDVSVPDPEREATFATALGRDTRIPTRVRRWASEVATATLTHLPRGWDPGAFARVLFAILERESHGGETLDAAGTGDKVGRTGKYLTRDDVRVVGVLPPGWRVPRRDDGSVVPGPYAIPADGLGWGRGLAQVDFGAHAFARGPLWRDPAANVLYGAKVLADAIRYWENRDGKGWPVETLAVASYNAGEGGVAKALGRGDHPDAATTGRDYSRFVLGKANAWGAGEAVGLA